MSILGKMKGAILPETARWRYGSLMFQHPGMARCLSNKGDHDLRQRYPLHLQEHTGKGPEGYMPGTIAGHEPCGVIVEESEGLKRFEKG